MRISDEIRQQIHASISNAFYDARNHGRTMTDATETATARVVRLIETAPLIRAPKVEERDS